MRTRATEASVMQGRSSRQSPWRRRVVGFIEETIRLEKEGGKYCRRFNFGEVLWEAISYCNDAVAFPSPYHLPAPWSRLSVAIATRHPL